MLEMLRRTVLDPLRELLLLERAEKAARAYAPEQLGRMQTLAAAADCRHRAAEVLSDEDQLPSAFLLEREAAKLAMGAVLVAKGREVDAAKLESSELAAGITALSDSGEIAPVPELNDALSHLAEANVLLIDDMPPEQAVARRAAMGRVTTGLRAQIDTRSPRAIRASRYVRLGVTAAAVVLLVVWGAVKLLSPKNLAYHKPVTASSRWPNQPPGSGPEGLSPGGLTDGTKNGSFGMCTREEVNPWALVDLEKPQKIGRVVVYNRDDCCQNHLPVVLELSNDGASFTEVGRRGEVFTESKPWRLRLTDRTARYVRVRIDGPSPHVLSLSELEVYAP